MEWLGWLFGGIGAAGIPAVWVWLERKGRAALESYAKSYRDLFDELNVKLRTTEDGFEQLQKEHTDCNVRVARMEERVANLERTVAEQRELNAELRATITDLRRQASPERGGP